MTPRETTYLLVDAAAATVTSARFKSLQEAAAAAGLNPHALDFGSLGDGEHNIVVYEFGLFEPVDHTHYFAIGPRLYAGNAVVFAERNDRREDVTLEPAIRWFANAQEVEQAIEMGDIDQPVTRINDEVVWMWPQPKPTYFEKEQVK